MVESIMQALSQGRLSATSAENTPEGQQYYVIHGHNGQPRWMFPVNIRAALGVLSQWRPYSPKAFWKWKLLLLLLRCQQAERIPGVKKLGWLPERNDNTFWRDFWGEMGWQKEQMPIPVIYVGTPGPFRKLVITLLNPDNHTPESIVKVPMGPQASASILHEATVLSQLQQSHVTLAPQFIYQNTARNITAQTFLKSNPTRPEMGNSHLEYLLKLAHPHATHKTDPVESLQHRYEAILNNNDHNAEFQSDLRNRLRVLPSLKGIAKIRTHGDFAPWNIRSCPDRQLRAVDWENYDDAGLPLQDIFHFHFMINYLLDTRKTVLSTLQKSGWLQAYLDFFGLTRKEVKILYQYYQLQLLAQQFEWGNYEQGQQYYRHFQTEKALAS